MTRHSVHDSHLEVRVAGSGPPVLLLHGFTGRAADWTSLAAALRRAGHRTISVDLLGHGRSPAPLDPGRYAIDRQAADLAALLRDVVGPSSADVVGYSMGARIALRLALDHPGAVRRLVLESPSSGIVDPTERAVRQAADERLATLLERDGIEAFVRVWEAQPIFARQAALRPTVRARLRTRRVANRPAALAASLRGAGQGVAPPAQARLGSLRAPTLLIAGALDLVGRGRAEAMAADIAGSRLEIVADASHAPHLERPAAFRRLVTTFLADPLKGAIMSFAWTPVLDYTDIRYEHSGSGIARITINRPEVLNAFRPETVTELIDAFRRVRDDASIGVVLFTGAGDRAFCSGGDQRYKGQGGYVGADGVARLNVLDLQRQIRSLPIPVIALVNGYAIGGGNVLQVVCDLTIAAEHALFGQTGPRVGSFDAGFGVSLLARSVGQKRAREIWYLCRQYSAAQAYDMGLVNAVVPLAELEAEGIRWADEILAKSPTAIRFLKRAFNADGDGLAGLQELAGDATMLYYSTEEAHEGSQAFLEKRAPDYRRFPRRP